MTPPQGPILRPARGRRSIAEHFDVHHNSLNALRLVLAAAVIVSHSGPLTGRTELAVGGRTLGTWAVTGFFLISGFLITRSRLRRSTRDYFRDRALRILPGFLVALLMTAFVFAPLGAVAGTGTSYRLSDAFSYVAHNALLYPPYLYQIGISHSVDPSLYFSDWNGPLYTLFYEGLCYVAIAGLVSLVPKRALGRVLLAAMILLTVAALMIEGSDRANAIALRYQVIRFGVPMGLAFVTGAVLWVYRDRVPLGPGIAAAAIGALWVIAELGQSVLLSALPFGLVLLYLGSVLPLSRVGSRFDLSYGIYIYGWPVQTLMLMLVPSLTLHAPALVDAALVLTVTWVFAAASCVLVERPALRHRARTHDASLRIPDAPVGLPVVVDGVAGA